jgi:hypothetical protein
MKPEPYARVFTPESGRLELVHPAGRDAVHEASALHPLGWHLRLDRRAGLGDGSAVVPAAGADEIRERHVTSRSFYAGPVTWTIFGLLLAAVAAIGAAAAAAMYARYSTTVTLTEPVVRGEVLTLSPDSRRPKTLVVRRVLDELTLAHVAVVGPCRRWHRWQWARRWL